jgi:pimeloyl-ACP methyl ester carboxylesterase
VLAGHSFGGLYIQSFAAQFPDQVAGMVLLDSTAPNPGPAQPTDTESYSLFRRVAVLLPAVAHLGAGRLLNPISYGTLPPRSRDEARANSATARHLASWIEELLAASASAHQASLLTDLDGKPLIVLTADTGNDAKHKSAQEHMATLSTNSLHRVAHDTTHQSLIDDEADAAAASTAIRDVVASVRSSQPLASR